MSYGDSNPNRCAVSLCDRPRSVLSVYQLHHHHLRRHADPHRQNARADASGDDDRAGGGAHIRGDQASGVFLAVVARDDGCAEEGDADLAAVGVAAEGEVDAWAAGCADGFEFERVGNMGEQHARRVGMDAREGALRLNGGGEQVAQPDEAERTGRIGRRVAGQCA